MHADHIRFPELPESLYSRPTLIWTLDNGGPRASGSRRRIWPKQLSWNADYVLTVGRDDKRATSTAG